MNRQPLPKATRQMPCGHCKKWQRQCLVDGPNGGYCHDIGAWWGTRQKASNGNGHHTGYVGRAHQKSSGSITQFDWSEEMKSLRIAFTDEHLKSLVESTGVPAAGWSKLLPGWATAADLKRLRASGAGWHENPPDGAYVFAEHAGDGRVAGLSFRAVDGRKGAPAGAKRGLIVPNNLAQLPAPVLVVEGASDVAACVAMGIAAIGRPSNRAGAEDVATMLDSQSMMIVGERDNKPNGAWPGRDGAKAVAQKVSAKWGEPVLWTLPPLGTKDIREWMKAKVATGLNFDDADAMRAAGAELLKLLIEAAKEAKPERRSQADHLVDMANEKYRLGISEDGDAFAVPNDGPAVAMMFRGGKNSLRGMLAKDYRATTGKTPSASALADCMTALEGAAQDAAPESISLRVGEHEDNVVIDLGDNTGRAIVVKSGGWAVEAVSPVLFRRTALTTALPEPVQANPMALIKLRAFLNVDDDTWPLLAGWMVAAAILEIPHPILLFTGEQGVGKSSAARFILLLVDPSAAPLRTEPRDAEQWAIAASGSWAVCLDNISHMTGWLSDALCKASTGDGLVRRKLYTDSDLAVLCFKRCIILTSIDAGALRGDLGDRLLLVDLERIADDHRRTEKELNEAFNAVRPELLGALLSAVSRTLAALPVVKLASMPRMADFARVLAALDAACPELTGGRAFDLFSGQRKRIASEVIESDAVAIAVMKLLESKDQWTGTAGELLTELTPAKPPRHWPANARALSGHLRRIRPALAAIDITHTPPLTSDKSRTHAIERQCIRPPEPPEPPKTGFSTAPDGIFDGRSVGGTETPTARPPEYRPADRPTKNGDFDHVNADSGGVGGVGGPNPLNSDLDIDESEDSEDFAIVNGREVGQL